MLDQFDKITEACATIAARWPHAPAAGLILGSGLGAAAAALTEAVTIPYESIPHFARSTAHGHAGQLVCGLLAGRPVVVMEGRMHAYEGYPLAQITFPVRVLERLGAGLLIVTSPRLTLLVALVIPLVVLPIVVLGRRLRKLSRESQDRIADLAAPSIGRQHQGAVAGPAAGMTE